MCGSDNPVRGIETRFVCVFPGDERAEFLVGTGCSVTMTVGDVLRRLAADGALSQAQVDLAAAALVLVNGEPIAYGRGWETPVSAGDRITFVTPLAGGAVNWE